MVVTKSDLYPNDTMGMENKTVIVSTILVFIHYFNTWSENKQSYSSCCVDFKIIKNMCH